MTEAEKRQRDIEGKLETIRQEWIEASKALSKTELATIRKAIATHLADLKDLISN